MTRFEQECMAQVSLYDIGILDGPPEEPFDSVTRLITRQMNIPVALLSVIDGDGDRQFFKSQIGLDEPWASRRQTPLSHSFCQYVVATGLPLVVEDARTHELVSCNAAIHDLGVIAYLGVPVFGPGTTPIAALCAIDGQPRIWSEAEIELISELAWGVTRDVRLRAAILAGNALLAAGRLDQAS